jgi:hypothetical protein
LSIDAVCPLKKLTDTKFYILIPLLLVVVILVACTPTPTLRNEAFMNDTSLITGEPCEAPCWQNLIPGETAWGVAHDFVKNSADYTITNETTASVRVREARIDFAIKDGPQCCRILTRDNETLSAILLLLSPEMLLGDVIKRYGEPAYLSGEAITDNQATVALVFPNIPMVTYVFAEDLGESELSDQSTLIGVMYLAQSEMDTLLQSENFYNWEGYGPLGSIIDGTFDITAQPQAAD